MSQAIVSFSSPSTCSAWTYRPRSWRNASSFVRDDAAEDGQLRLAAGDRQALRPRAPRAPSRGRRAARTARRRRSSRPATRGRRRLRSQQQPWTRLPVNTIDRVACRGRRAGSGPCAPRAKHCGLALGLERSVEPRRPHDHGRRRRRGRRCAARAARPRASSGRSPCTGSDGESSVKRPSGSAFAPNGEFDETCTKPGRVRTRGPGRARARCRRR